MLDYKKTEDMERMKAEAVKRLKWDYPDCSEIGTIGIKCTYKGIIRTF